MTMKSNNHNVNELRFPVPARINWAVYHRVMANRMVAVCLVLLAIMAIIALLAPWIAPYDPNDIDLRSSLASPSSEHILGTDHLGRDILSRLLYGTTTSFSIAISVVAFALFMGILLGGIAGYFGGLADDIISRVIDLFLSFPSMIFALAIVGALGSSVPNLILALALVNWASYARLMRGQVLSIKSNDYVSSARVIGASDARILVRHILPNAISPVIVLATLDMGHVILSAAALSFLGLGIPPSIPEWGSMLNAGKEFMRTAPNLTIFPGMAITFTVILFSLLGDGFREVLDPESEVSGLVAA
jgi:peptide/nickel transport system permease protein